VTFVLLFLLITGVGIYVGYRMGYEVGLHAARRKIDRGLAHVQQELRDVQRFVADTRRSRAERRIVDVEFREGGDSG